jgi:hypothetical protein
MATPTATIDASAVLVDSAGNPLPSETATFQFAVSGGGTKAPLGSGSATTDNTGTAALSGTVSAPATYDFFVNFAATPQHAGSSDQVLGVQVIVGTKITLKITVV